MRYLTLLLVTAAFLAQTKTGHSQTGQTRSKAPTGTQVFTYQVVKSYPHDRTAFTQGLLILDGQMYESTGLNGKSNIRRVDLETGRVMQIQNVPQQYFGEGLAAIDDRLIELTWQNGVGFVYDRKTFKMLKIFPYSGEGWGLTSDGKRLILSDGTENLRFLDPTTLKETGRVAVTDAGRPIKELNELEYIRGEVWANVWQTNRIARINIQTGRVTSWINLTGILPVMDTPGTDVLNGIAYDAQRDRIFITGKLWPKLFEIKVVKAN
ncbi:MAG: glutaminyl-peptide cyclotransferase [Acidobacteriota bacterium]